MRWFIGFAAIAALLIAATGLSAQETGSAKQGLGLARGTCATCHGVENGDDFSPNPLAPTFEMIADTPGMTATALAVALRTNHDMMPDFILQSDELADLTAYILTLKGEE